MANENVRVDTTFIGYLIIGMMFLIFGVFGFEEAGMFGDAFKDQPIDWHVLGEICAVVGLLLIVLSVFAYRTGKATSAGVFVFFAMYFFIQYVNAEAKSGAHSIVPNSDWFLFMAIAIFFIILTICALVSKAPKFLSAFLLIAGVMMIFMSINCMNGIWGQDNADLYKAMAVLYGIFSLLGFIVATYLGLAYANPKKIPLI